MRFYKKYLLKKLSYHQLPYSFFSFFCPPVLRVVWGKRTAILQLICIKSITSPFPRPAVISLHRSQWSQHKTKMKRRKSGGRGNTFVWRGSSNLAPLITPCIWWTTAKCFSNATILKLNCSICGHVNRAFSLTQRFLESRTHPVSTDSYQ